MYSEHKNNTDFFMVQFSSANGIYNYQYICELANLLCDVPKIHEVDLDDIDYDIIDSAINYINSVCGENIRFDFTEQNDVVFAHCDNECWS